MPKEKVEPPREHRAHRILQRNEIAEGKRSKWTEMEIFGLVNNLSPCIWKLHSLTALYLDNNHLTHLPPGVGRLTSLLYLEASNNYIEYLPEEIGELVQLRELRLAQNRIRELPAELGYCFQLEVLDLSNNPLLPDIMKYYSEGTQKLIGALMDMAPYELVVPPTRPWIPTGQPDKDVPSAVFSVMCYNVLCDKLCTKAMYAYCPTWALQWDYRKKGIMADILRGDGDIITLQEVETEQYYCTFLPELAREGYEGIFLPKSRVRTMNSEKEKKQVDGCAIFYKKNKFEKVNEFSIEFSQLATKEGASNTDTDMINRVSTKDNIAIVAVLRTKSAVYDNSPVPAPPGLSQMLMVSTAHIHWDPAYPDVKLVQTIMLLDQLHKFVKETMLQFRRDAPPPSLDGDLCQSMPLILCGDFNSLPDSGVYEYISKGFLSPSHKDFDGQNYREFMKDRQTDNLISHNFKLKSAYTDVIPFTNYTYDFKGVIDYVFYSGRHLRLHTVMGLQDPDWFTQNRILGCPHPFVPSDHFPLFAEFSLPYYR